MYRNDKVIRRYSESSKLKILDEFYLYQIVTKTQKEQQKRQIIYTTK